MSNLTQKQMESLGIKKIIKVTKANNNTSLSREKQIKAKIDKAIFNTLKDEQDYIELKDEIVLKVSKNGEAKKVIARGHYIIDYDPIKECFNILDIKTYYSHLNSFDLRNPICVKMVAQSKK